VVGIEWDHAACLTAVAAGHRRIRADVSRYCIAVFAGVEGLIASPPCQAWSMAGKRQGEIDRAKVHALVDAYANGSDDPGTGWADERSHHAAQPVRWVRDLRPPWVAFEQVPPVLGLWQHVAERFRRWGYSTWTGVLNSADYGVPQTRERAILIARLDGPAQPPAPTHVRAAGGLFDASQPVWVSMQAATGHRGAVRTAQNSTLGGGEVEIYVRNASLPAPTLTANWDRWRWVAPVTSDRRWRWGDPEEGVRISPAEASTLQSFREDYPWRGSKADQSQQLGNAFPPLMAAAVVGTLVRAKVPA
jgi:DNA (cytosine-5)-methyltransferase 1